MPILIFAFLYFKIAHDHHEKWKKFDLALVASGTTFLTIAYFTAIFLFLKPNENPWSCLASLPLIWIFLLMGWFYSKGKENKLAIAFYQTQYIPMIVALSVPLSLQNTNFFILLGLDFAFLFTYLLLYLIDHWRGFWYVLPITISYIYYLTIQEALIAHRYMSVAFLIPGIIAIAATLWLYSRDSKWKEIFLFWWVTSGVMGLLTLNSQHVSMGYSLVLWGVMYGTLSTYAKFSSEKLKSYFLTAGHTMCCAAALSILFFNNSQAMLYVYLLIGIGYLMMYIQNKKEN